MRFRWLIWVASMVACGRPVVSEPHVLFSADPLSLENAFPDPRLLSVGGLAARSGFYEPFLPADIRPPTRAFLDSWTPMLDSVTAFCNFANIAVRFSEEPAPDSLPENVVYGVSTGGGPWIPIPASVQYIADPTFGPEQKFMLVRPVLPLPGGSCAVLAIRKGVSTSGGKPFLRSDDFEAFALGSGEGDTSIAANLTVNGTPFADRPEDVVWSMRFMVPDATVDLKTVAAWIESSRALAPIVPAQQTTPIPQGEFLATDPTFSALDPWLLSASFPIQNRAHVGIVVIGQLPSRDLRDPSTGIFDPAWVSDPSQAPLAPIEFVLTVPIGPKPAGGWPTIVGGHGLGGRNSLARGQGSFCMGLGELFAEQGMACIGIDAVDHGDRGSLLNFFDVSDLRKTRDNFRQTAVDTLMLSHMIKSVDLDGDGTPDLSPRVLYYGNSMGGVMGATFLALDQSTQVGVLNVPGAGLTTILTASKTIHDEFGVFLSEATDIPYQTADYYASFPFFEVVGQFMADAADPVNYGGLLASKTVLVQQGLGDKTMPAVATQILVESIGIPPLTANATSPGGLSGLVQVNPAQFGIADPNFNPHNVFSAIPGVRTEVVQYLASRGTVLVMP